MNKMDPCPWCGTDPDGIPSVSGTLFYRCSNSMCVMQQMNPSMNELVWNTAESNIKLKKAIEYIHVLRGKLSHYETPDIFDLGW